MFKRFRWVFLVKLPAGALAGLLIAAVVTCLTPKIYESEAVIEVKPCANLPVAALGRTEGEVPGWLLSEIEKMKSCAVLEKVTAGLEFTNRWNLAKDEVLPVLVHDYPMIADSPISPNVTLNLAIGTALGLVLSPLLALPVMWRLNRRTPVAES